jgi:hypothetical protein
MNNDRCHAGIAARGHAKISGINLRKNRNRMESRRKRCDFAGGRILEPKTQERIIESVARRLELEQRYSGHRAIS